MSDESFDFQPLPRGKRTSGNRRRKRKVVGAGTPSRPRRSARTRTSASASDNGAASPRVARRRAKRKSRWSWLKYVALGLILALGVYVVLNLQAPPPEAVSVSGEAVTANTTPTGKVARAAATPTSGSIFSIFQLPQLPTAEPTAAPTSVIPDIAIVAGHWSKENTEGAPVVRDGGASCPDGLREVDITKSVADKTLARMQQRGFHSVLLEEFDPRLKKADPDFAPRAFLSIHADSCLTGADYSFATGYKIAHAEPSDNLAEDSRLVTCLTRSFDRVAAQYDKPFNANTITRNMTEYHGFREIDPSTPAAIIELGFLGYDREFLVDHQDEMADGLADGLEEFLKGSTCLPPTATPEPTETTIP